MKLFSTIYLLLFFSFNIGLAQQKSISLTECIDLSLKNSYLIQANESIAQSAEKKVKDSQTDYYPLIYGELSHHQLFYSDTDYPQQNINALLDWSMGSLIMKTALADVKAVEILKMKTKQSMLEVVRRTTNLYLGILKNRQEQKLIDERMRIIERHLKIVEALWHGGVKTEFDLLQTKSTINLLQENRVRLEMEIEVLQAALAKLMNLPAETKFSLVSFSEKIIDATPGFSQQHILQNPAVLGVGLQAEQQRLVIKSIKASNLPHITAFGGYAVDGDPTAEGNYWQAGIGLQLPLYRWGKTSYQKQELQIKSKALGLKKREIKRDLSIQENQIKNRLDKLKEIYKIRQQREELSQKAVDIATINYQAGLITNLEYLNAEKVNVFSRIALNEAQLLYVQQLIEGYLIGNQIEKIKQLQETK
jgi:outer membrane protein